MTSPLSTTTSLVLLSAKFSLPGDCSNLLKKTEQTKLISTNYFSQILKLGKEGKIR